MLKSIRLFRVNNSRILMIKNVIFSGYYLYMNLNIQGEIFKSGLVYLIILIKDN